MPRTRFRFDVTVKNQTLQPMATLDGVTPHSVGGASAFPASASLVVIRRK